jgi:hypothetical protein
MRRRVLLLPAVLAVTLLAACGEDEPASTAPAGTTEIAVEVTGAGADPVRIELRCGGSESCDQAQLDKLAAVAEQDDAEGACTQQYGGPEKAHMTGTLEGEPVDVTITRTNGCEIADYDALFAALGRKPPLSG